MKKYISLFLAAALAFFCLTACSTGANTPAAKNEKIKIVTTIFPEYDWVKNVLGENPAEAELVLLLDNGTDLHSYQPSAKDIVTISTCDLFVYVGGESDAWVAEVLKNATNKDMVVLDLLEVLGDAAKEEELVEGMQEDEHDHEHEKHEDADEHDHEHEEHDDADDHDHDHDEGPEYDEHVWLSLRNAETFVKSITESLKKVDPDHGETYQKNADTYLGKLEELDGKYQKTVEEAQFHTLLFGDRFPFRYLVDDYGLDYYAAFIGCSAETEASFETVTFLSGKTEELKLPAVLTIDGSDGRIAETIIRNSGDNDRKILTLDSMQSVTSKEIQSGTTYLSVMEKDLEVLKTALNP